MSDNVEEVKLELHKPGRPPKDVEDKLETANRANQTLRKRYDALSANYDTLYRQFTLLEEKYKALQVNHIEKSDLLEKTTEERNNLDALIKRYNYKDRYPRNVRTQTIK